MPICSHPNPHFILTSAPSSAQPPTRIAVCSTFTHSLGQFWLYWGPAQAGGVSEVLGHSLIHIDVLRPGDPIRLVRRLYAVSLGCRFFIIFFFFFSSAMQRRNGNKPNGVGRQNSAASAQSVQLLHISPEVAERDAQAAAAQAYARAKGRSETGENMWPPVRDENTMEQSRPRTSPGRHRAGSAPLRQQSVRFIKPKPSSSGLAHSSLGHGPSSRPLGTPTLRSKRSNVASRPSSQSSATAVTYVTKGTAGDYINAFITGEEYYTPEDDIASVPSSFRRLRKSRSLFTGSEMSESTQSETANSRFPVLSRQQLGQHTSLSPLKAPKSMSFLRSRRDQFRPSTSWTVGSGPLGDITNGHSSSLADEKLGVITSHSSMFLRGKPNHLDKPFRKTLRNTTNTATARDGMLPPNSGLKKKAREASQNLKTRLKSLFSLGKAESGEGVLPLQQIEARKTHVSDLDPHDNAFDNIFMDENPMEDASLSRVASGIPSLHDVPSEQQLRSRQGSLETLRSERRVSDEKSRVSSWSNSDSNTIATIESLRGDWERQRLSIIRENGTHITSSSGRDQVPIDSFPLVTEPVDEQQSVPATHPAPVDSQRIYSALMKRLNETQEVAKSIQTRQHRSIENFLQKGLASTTQVSRSNSGAQSDAFATIRRIASRKSCGDTKDASELTAPAKPPSTSFSGARRSKPAPLKMDNLQPGAHDLSSIGNAALASGSGKSRLAGNRRSSPCLTSPRTEDTPCQIRPLSARSSAFFGSPTCHLFRTQSPYRRALQGNIRASVEASTPMSPEFQPFMEPLKSLPIRSVSTCGSETDKRMQYAESIYSCETGDMRNSSVTLSLVDRFPIPPNNHGDATIFVDPPKYQPLSKLPYRVASSASSVEWKSWLSANVSKLEDSSVNLDCEGMEVRDSSVPKLPHPSGHVRENAQISEDDEDEAQDANKGATRGSAQSTDALSASKLPEEPSPDAQKVTPILMEESEAPPIPRKSSLRSAASMSSMSSSAGRTPTPTRLSFRSSMALPDQRLLERSRIAREDQPRRAASPVKLVRRNLRPMDRLGPPQILGLGQRDENQAGKAESVGSSRCGTRLPTPVKSENIEPHTPLRERPTRRKEVEPFGTDEFSDSQATGSKRMVDVFLNSRRSGTAGHMNGAAFL